VNCNLPGDGTLTYTYDTENRLLTATKTGMSASYAYDPMGRRQTKTVNGTTTLFVDNGDTEVAEYDGTSGNLLRRYVPGAAIDDLIAMVDCTNATPPNCTGSGVVKTFFHVDKMGSVVAMSKSDGTLAEGPYTYDPYGNCVGGGSSCGAGEPYRFTGQRLDPETGLYYYRARYYSPALGRFLQTDPIGYKDDIDWYTYVGNDPTDKTDPTGKITLGEAIEQKFGNFIAPITSGYVPGMDGKFTNPLTQQPVSNQQGLATMATIVAPVMGPAAEEASFRAIPDTAIVVRGGASETPASGVKFSGAAGSTLEDAAQGVPHNKVSSTTAGDIRSSGGTVQHAPEKTRAGNMNEKHVNIVRGNQNTFGQQQENPVPKKDRIQ